MAFIIISSQYNGLKVAIKKFTMNENMTTFDKQKFVERVHREIRYGYSQRHENLVRIYGCCSNYSDLFDQHTEEQWNLPLCIMEYGGESLKKYLENNANSMTFEEKKRILLGIARGIQHIHSQELVHRDLKVVDWMVSYL